MKRLHPPLLRLALVAGLAAAQAQPPSPPAAPADTPSPKNLTELIELPRQTLSFKPTRDDISVRSVVFSVSDFGGSVHPEAEGMRINGVVPKNSHLYLKQVGKNQFELPALKIEYSSEVFGGPLYLALKVWFNEVSNGDGAYYQDYYDRYALLTYCTNEADDPALVNARWGANRAKTFGEFKERLAAPLALKLNHKPLQEGLGYPIINNAWKRLTEADLKAVEKLMRDRGEEHLFAVSEGLDADHALVHASVKDATEFYGRRIYHAVRADGTWRVESVETVENTFSR